ncbi:thiosulfate/3-mercaptopyruvate sulfurtransferase [Parasphingorhabdus marina DSM 22363]|uniref:3-mercaptopyruvate sulfurtransferase n=1 Tax=Parasphingorhabdus marina DSM 22363 TaxID=1123272 RepID=A0A1N6CXZ7_9SPHN|nr:3-mercaptopyruvate sulfurtransferase [Parasphingorhabdus marina]SIN63458.1 thiosulfate/3-mercaptopyruvate sulfurtransferase [Parasphingorhabdus marina DSM 22363]
MELLVTTDWLANELGASDLRIVDATKFMPDAGRNPAAEYEAGHIPGAVFMDLEDLTDTGNPIENMLPPPEKFASRMQSLGLGDGSRIVLYDDSPLKSAARAWWMLTIFGAHEVAILDGGIAKWKAEGRPLETGKEALRHRHFTVWKDDKDVRTKADMLSNLHSKEEQVVDARPAGRFTGAEEDPRPGIASGHIPGSVNIPHSAFYNADGTWKSPDEVKAIFDDAGVDLGKPVVTTCGSGMTAAVVSFAAALAGGEKLALYDGSWSEWGADADTPKATA